MMRRRVPKAFDLDVSSFSDIAFLLIIFFILTTSLSKPMGRIIDVPAASKPETQTKEKRVPSVNVLPDRVLLGEGTGAGREVTLSELRAELLKRNFPSAPPQDRMVVVEIAEEVSYERYYRIVTMIAGTGGVIAMVSD